MKRKSPVFEENYQYYLEQIKDVHFQHIAPILGADVEGDEMVIPFFGKFYRVAKKGIRGPSGKKPEYFISIVLFKYILLCPEYAPASGDWQSFKDFRDAAPLISYFQRTVKTVLTRHFSGRLERLQWACKKMGGYPPDIHLSHDLSMTFDALPKIPLLLTFNDREDEFPAQCSVLFQKQTENYLDMECTAGLGNMLAAMLMAADEEPGH
jgi:hypothetical protein